MMPDDMNWKLAAPAGTPAPRRSALGQRLLETHDPLLGRLQRRLLVLLDGRRDPYVLGLILDDMPVVEELLSMRALGWVEWDAAPAGLRRAA